MLGQAAGFAVLAAISPTSLLVMAVFLGSANPRTTALLYVAGAMLMTVVMAVVVLVVLRAVGMNQPREHDPRYGLRLGLGFLCLVAVIVTRRARRSLPALGTPAGTAAAGTPAASTAAPAAATAAAGTTHAATAGTATAGTATAATAGPPPGFVGRLVAEPRPGTAFAVGLLLFAPSATFIAAVQVIATANASTTSTALALIVVVIITGLIVWLPLLAYLAVPEPTTRRLRVLNGWLRANGRAILMGALAAGGLVLIINGSLGLAGA